MGVQNYICVEKPELWVNEAINLKYSAIVLNEYTSSCQRNIFDKEKPSLDLPAFWTPRIERMLWGYAFENLFKAIIIVNLRKRTGIRKVPFGEIKNHDLVELAKMAAINISEDEEFYLEICRKCSEWAGRYPIPLNLHGLPQKRKAMKTREELIERSLKQGKLYLQGKIKRLVEESDVLHSGIGTIELKIYEDLFSRLKGMFT